MEIITIHPDIKKFWSGEGVSFFHQELHSLTDIGKHNMLYCRDYNGYYNVIAKTLPYLKKDKPINCKYEIYYLNDLSPQKYSTMYSEQEMLRLIKLKVFL